jgi:hypothetical protein
MSKVHSDIFLSTPAACLVPYCFLNPKRSSSGTSSVFISVLPLSILTSIFAVYVMKLTVQLLLHFVAL